MRRKFLPLATVALVIWLPSSTVLAQEQFEFRFDGVADDDPQPADPTDWMTSENWDNGGADPFGPPFTPLVPDDETSAEIVTSTVGVNAPVIGPGDDAEAFDVRIGRFAGEGLLTMTGGTLTTVDSCLANPFTCNRRIRVGAAQTALPENRNPGTFNLIDGVVTTDTLWIGSGSQGTMNMSGGVVNTRSNFSLDWTFDAGSVLNMTGGTINVGTVFDDDIRMYRNSTLNLDGGEILVAGAAGFGLASDPLSQGGEQDPNVTVSITDGLLEANDELLVNGSVTVSGGILRAESFSEGDSTGTVEINDDGLLQLDNSQESVMAVEALISGGVFTTSAAAGLLVNVVDVDGTDFTQVSVASVGVPGDLDGDGDVDGKDFLEIQRSNPDDIPAWQLNFGAAPPPLAAATVPEPGSFVLVMVAGGLMFGRSRNAGR